jgi:CRISPR-associated protein Cmr6
MRQPKLPQKLASAVRNHDGPRHPFLVQGMLFDHWKPKQKQDEQDEKAAEIEEQASNLRAFALAKQHAPILGSIAKRQGIAAGLRGFSVYMLEATAEERVLIGTGLANQLETGFLLHPLYGVPYLPGSAIKGVTRSALLLRWAAEAGISPLSFAQQRSRAKQLIAPTPLEQFERLLLASAIGDAPWEREVEVLEATLARWPSAATTRQALRAWTDGAQGREKGQLFTRLFGSPPLNQQTSRSGDDDRGGTRGEVRFLDAFPTTFETEHAVQTPQATSYYRAAMELFAPVPRTAPPPKPLTLHEPIPIHYLAVKSGSVFRVVIAAPEPSLAKAAASAVASVLTTDGIGAKRGIGFGRFRIEQVQG